MRKEFIKFDKTLIDWSNKGVRWTLSIDPVENTANTFSVMLLDLDSADHINEDLYSHEIVMLFNTW